MPVPNQYSGPYTEKQRIANFWNHVNVQDESECWEWQGACSPEGYGRTWNGKKRVHSHRYALEITIGKQPENTMGCLHKCGNPKCVNPTHLYWGTSKDNHADMVRHGRSTTGRHEYSEGIKNPASKLNPQKIVVIRALLENGWSGYKVAKRFDVSQTTIYRIGQRQIWRHVI